MLAWPRSDPPPKHRDFEKWDDEGPVLGYIGCGCLLFAILGFALIVFVSYTLGTRGG